MAGTENRRKKGESAPGFLRRMSLVLDADGARCAYILADELEKMYYNNRKGSLPDGFAGIYKKVRKRGEGTYREDHSEMSRLMKLKTTGGNDKMKKMTAIAALILMMMCASVSCFGDSGAGGNVYLNPSSPFRDGAFFGVWIGASKDLPEAQRQASDMAERGVAVQIFLTTDWNNLNPEPWYVLTAGMYASEYEASLCLPQVQAYCPDAYIKYSGSYKGTPRSFYPGSSGNGSRSAFYGIWCGASKTFGEAQGFGYTMQQKGYPAAIYYTVDWTNLNPEPWYVVSAGSYSTRESAEAALSRVRSDYPDAYIKYSGEYRGG